MLPDMGAYMFGVGALGDAECSLTVVLSQEACLANTNCGVTPLETPV